MGKQYLDPKMLKSFRRGCFEVYAKIKAQDIRRYGRGRHTTATSSRKKKILQLPTRGDEAIGRSTGSDAAKDQTVS